MLWKKKEKKNKVEELQNQVENMTEALGKLDLGSRLATLEEHIQGRNEVFQRTQPWRYHNELQKNAGESNAFISPAQFEATHFLNVSQKIKDGVCALISYVNTPLTLDGLQSELLLRSWGGGGIALGHNEVGDFMVLGTVNGMTANPWSGFLATSWDFKALLPSTDSSKYYQITRQNLPQVQSGELDPRYGFVVLTNKNSYFNWFDTDFDLIDHYTGYLALIKRIERGNLIQSQTPNAITGVPEGVEQDMVRSKYLMGDIFWDIDVDGSAIDVSAMPLDVRDNTQRVQMAYKTNFNELLTLLGVYNATDQGMERMVAGQVSANNHVIELMGDTYLSGRQRGLYLANDAWGYEMDVIYNQRVAQTFKYTFQDPLQNFQEMERSRMVNQSGFNTQSSMKGANNG